MFTLFFSLQMLIENTLKPNWDWLMLVLDSTEAQLRFGSALANSTDPNQPGHPLSARSVASVASRIAASVSTGEPASSTSRGFTGARSGIPIIYANNGKFFISLYTLQKNESLQN